METDPTRVLSSGLKTFSAEPRGAGHENRRGASRVCASLRVAARKLTLAMFIPLLLTAVDAYTLRGACAPRPAPRSSTVEMQHSVGWDGFGKGPFRFYEKFDKFMAVFPDEDRQQYPDMFELPKGCYEVELPRPLGIAFEEVVPGRAVQVDYLVDDGNAAASGVIEPGDVLYAVTAVKVFGARYERKLIPCIDLDFDTIMGAIGSNEPKWKCKGVVLQFMRPSEADEKAVRSFLEFFEIPANNVWRTS